MLHCGPGLVVSVVINLYVLVVEFFLVVILYWRAFCCAEQFCEPVELTGPLL
jgi:hypothetical protein